MHSGSALQAEGDKNFLKGRVRIYMGWYSLSRHVVICCHLVEIAEFSQDVSFTFIFTVLDLGEIVTRKTLRVANLKLTHDAR